MDTMLSELGEALKRYAETEHGKRAAQHAHIMQDLFGHAEELADEIGRLYAIERIYERTADVHLDA